MKFQHVRSVAASRRRSVSLIDLYLVKRDKFIALQRLWKVGRNGLISRYLRRQTAPVEQSA
jgi:hypothetical protein